MDDHEIRSYLANGKQEWPFHLVREMWAEMFWNRAEIKRLKIAAQEAPVDEAEERVRDLERQLAEANHNTANQVRIWARETEALRADVARANEELESHAWEISPAMAQARIESLNAEVERLTTMDVVGAKAHNSNLLEMGDLRRQLAVLEQELAEAREENRALRVRGVKP